MAPTRNEQPMSRNVDGDTLGSRLEEARRERGITQLELSRRIGAHVSTVRRWERGVNSPEAWWRDALCEVLGPEFEVSGRTEAARVYEFGRPSKETVA